MRSKFNPDNVVRSFPLMNDNRNLAILWYSGFVAECDYDICVDDWWFVFDMNIVNRYHIECPQCNIVGNTAKASDRGDIVLTPGESDIGGPTEIAYRVGDSDIECVLFSEDDRVGDIDLERSICHNIIARELMVDIDLGP